MFNSIKNILDILIPRFIEERVILTLNDTGEYRVVCLEKDYEHFRYATGFGACEIRGISRAFNLFGYGVNAQVTLDI